MLLWQGDILGKLPRLDGSCDPNWVSDPNWVKLLPNGEVGPGNWGASLCGAGAKCVAHADGGKAVAHASNPEPLGLFLPNLALVPQPGHNPWAGGQVHAAATQHNPPNPGMGGGQVHAPSPRLPKQTIMLDLCREAPPEQLAQTAGQQKAWQALFETDPVPGFGLVPGLPLCNGCTAQVHPKMVGCGAPHVDPPNKPKPKA